MAVAKRVSGKYSSELLKPEDIKIGKKYRIRTEIDGVPIKSNVKLKFGYSLNDTMMKFLGDTVTIKRKNFDFGDGTVIYDVEENIFSWPNELLERI